MSSPITKQLAPGVTLSRTEDVHESCIVYTVNNMASTVRWCFTFDFRESTNFYLRPIATPFESTTKDTHKGLLRRTIVEPNTTLEVARLTVVNPKLKSNLQVHYGWEERQQSSSTPNKFTDFGTTQIKTEALASDVDLITARTDLKDGHSKFVYRIKSKRRESLKVILDFAGSKNLALVNTGVHNRLSRFIFSSKKSKSTHSSSTALLKEVRVTRGTTRVAKLRTVVPRQGWALNHNVTFEMKTLVNDLNVTQPTHPGESAATDTNVNNALQHCASAPPSNATSVHTRSQLPKRRPEQLRRISMTRASAGFERGLLMPQTPATIHPVETKDTNLLTDMLRAPSAVPVVPVVGTHPAPSRMSWLDAEIFQHVNGSEETVVPNSKRVTFARDSMDTDTSEESVEGGEDNNDGRCSVVPFVQPPTSLVAAHAAAASNNQVYQMLETIHLHELYYTRFETEAFHGIQLLMALANDSKIEFRSALKEIGVDKAGHREQILQAVLAMEL